VKADFANRWHTNAHYVVEGRPFSSVNAILRIAREKGYNGSVPAFTARIKAGKNTWEQLAKPINKARARVTRERYKKKVNEMRDFIAALDVRKKERL
jgi:hypothetical protein